MATNYPTFQSDPRLSSVSASLATINTVTASVVSASSYLGASVGESAIYVGNKTISGSLTVSSSINTLRSITSSADILVNTLSVGKGAGITSYPENIVLGKGSLTNNVNSIGNVAIGTAVLTANTTGQYNTAIGSPSLTNNKTGSDNVAIGASTLYYNDTFRNTAIGRTALIFLATGSDNIAIGNNAGSYYPGSISYSLQSSVIIGGNNGQSIQGTTGSIIISDGVGNIRIQANNTGLVTIPGTLAVSGGIRFPATMVSSSDPNTLDDYEEGSWTPAFSGSTTSNFSYTTQIGNYTKIGNHVTCWGRMLLSSTGSSAGGVYVTGLPFTISSFQQGLIANYYSSFTSDTLFIGGTPQTTNASSVLLYYANAVFSPGSMSQVTVSNLKNNSYIVFVINYTT